MTDDKLQAIKATNEEIIRSKGYGVNEWLPLLNNPRWRTLREIKGRIGVMAGLVNLAFEAPTHAIKSWIEKNKLQTHLSTWENQILSKKGEDLSKKDLINLSWYVEPLWALMWATNIIVDIAAEQEVGNNMASLLPNVEKGESIEKIERINNMRSEDDLTSMVDYYYRLHWYCVDERHHGRIPDLLNEEIISERRKALEWIYDRSQDWDNVEMGT